jgi:hypothetical protein
MNTSFDLSLDCKRPSICISGSLCQNTNTSGCCWHEDKRINKNKIYIDGYGDIDPTELSLTSFDLVIPQDIHYCPSCKVTKVTFSEIIHKITQTLPSPEEYQRRLTLEQKERDRIFVEKMRERLKIENARRAKKKAQKPQDKYSIWLSRQKTY